jgi:hypothetical protein
VSVRELEGILERTKSVLSQAEHTTLKAAVDTLALVTQELESKRARRAIGQWCRAHRHRPVASNTRHISRRESEHAEHADAAAVEEWKKHFADDRPTHLSGVID